MKRDVIVNLIITLTLAILGFVINKVFAEKLGAESLGVFKLFTQMIAYLSLAEMGLATASSYALYKPLAEQDYKKVSTIFSTLHSFYIRISLVVFLLGIAAMFMLPHLIESTIKNVNIIWLFFVINTALSYTFARFSILLTADGSFGAVRLIQGGSRILVSFLQILSLIYFESFYIFSFLMVTQNILSFYFLKKKFERTYTEVHLTKDRESGIFRNMYHLMFHTIGGLVVFNTDFIVLAKFTTLETVAVYASYIMICNLIMTFVNIIFPVLSPIVGSAIATNDASESYSMWKRINFFFFIFAILLCVPSFYLINPFVEIWMGKDYLLEMPVVLALVINLFLSITRLSISLIRNGAGIFNDIYNPIIEAGINLTVSIILVQKIGVLGVIVGTICSSVIVLHCSHPYLVFKKFFKMPFVLYFKEIILNYAILIFASSLIYLSINSFVDLNFDSISNFIKSSLIVFVITCIVCCCSLLLRKPGQKLIANFIKEYV